MVRRLSLWSLVVLSVFANPANAQDTLKPRILVALDTSGSMAFDLGGTPTFGDGMSEPTYGTGCGSAAGIDTNCDGLPNDSRMYIAKSVLADTFLSQGDVDWGLARFDQLHQDDAVCNWVHAPPPTGTFAVGGIDIVECNGSVSSYGDPTCNRGGAVSGANCPGVDLTDWPAACRPGSGGRPAIQLFDWQESLRDIGFAPLGIPPLSGDGNVLTNPYVCIDYGAGNCDGSANSGQVLVGFPGLAPFTGGNNTNALLKWVDNQQTNFNTSSIVGNVCNHAGSGNCELRPVGRTPLAGTLLAAQSYMTPIRSADPAGTCRPYSVMLITDGQETCSGNPAAAAATLLANNIKTYVIGLSINPGGRALLNSIAAAGGTDAGAAGGDRAFFADDPDTLSAALSVVVAESLLFEVCNNLDDDCDGMTDEGFTKFCDAPTTTDRIFCESPGESCDEIDNDCDGLTDEGVRNACGACGAVPAEVCDGIDNNCNGVIDEGGVCAGCVPSSEICDNRDNDCDSRIDEDLERACGTDAGVCTAGTQVCTRGVWGTCSGRGPSAEVCDARDNDCDGVIDGNARACGSSVGACVPGVQICSAGRYGSCTGEVGPSAELCDEIDNDCDGRVDEGNPGGGARCGTSLGECTRGALRCRAGALVCEGGTGPTDEVCDNRDNDCDGGTDEAVPTRGACGSGTGSCRQGVSTCVAGRFTCVGGRGPTDEVCDAMDNDCDASTDEGNPGGGSACGTSAGICSRGRTRCVAGALACEGGTGPMAELCDSLDNDCDGLIDEGNPGGGGACGDTDVGECEFGAQACMDGMLICVGETGPTDEICDGLDNDCDGSTDEGDPEGGTPCGDDTGECTAGVTRCVAGMLTCAGGTGPTDEICDGLDNNCNGVSDEGLGVGAPCGTDEGECAPGVNICRDGMLVCEGGAMSRDEVCDGLDNDCDAIIDEALPLGGPCGSDEGLCELGALSCIDGREICVGEVPPGIEVCDCEDNDCDGLIDEESGVGLCPGESACVDCSCSASCVMTEFGFSCPPGKVASEVDGECWCVAERCRDEVCETETIERDGEVVCSPETEACACKSNECTFNCDGVVCSDGTVCDPRDGRCAEDSCRGLGCDDGFLCDAVTGLCEEDPCADVVCGAGEACRDGVCEASCAEVMCEDDETCVAGICLEDPCSDVTCADGEVCNPADGTCVEDACTDVRCPDGALCDPLTGECGADPCADLTCPDGQMCVAGECIRESMPMDAGPRDAGMDADTGRPDEERRVLATGSGGCSCSVPGSQRRVPPLGLAFVFVTLAAFVRRRRRRPFGRSAREGARKLTVRSLWVGLSALAALVMLSGCKVDPYCITCTDGEVTPDTNMPDTGVPDTRPDVTRPDTELPDTELPDTNPDGCTAGAPELCNEFDDDCDGRIDEEVDTSSDPNNCGSCGTECRFDGAFPVCADGLCAFTMCDVGRYDLDGDPSNGCEYRCVVTAEDDTLCDLRDNDCDGEVDEDVTFETDPVNCGSCGRVCRFAHVISPRCSDGACTFTDEDCEEDFYDIDDIPTTGCEYSCTPADPAIEVCNNRDDDCDGTVDEGDPGGGPACGSDEGACSRGVLLCEDGALICNGEVAPATEACNGDDDDCDGSIDESNPDGGRLCGMSVGTCELGREVCTAGALVCMGDTGPSDELCDGLDNDCDSRIDEGDPGGGAACGATTGECDAGALRCRGGVLVCEGATGSTDEACDGLDNDCDGRTDEGNPGGGGDCGTDVGACLPGTRTCTGGAIVCVGATLGGAELCNTIDDDCDGSVDEGDPGGGGSCGDATGSCAPGAERCVGGTLVCTGATGPVVESCNSADDDCDGRTDESFSFNTDLNNCGGCGVRCMFTNAIAGCVGGDCDILACDSGYVDLDGNEANGCEYECSFNGAEICNGEDDDCDGTTDESLTPPSNFCNPNGVCAGTAATCGGAAGWECDYPSTFEDVEATCDARDNDCDGGVDETFPTKGDPCANGLGACARNGVFVCNAPGDGVVCNAGAAGAPTAEQCNSIDDDCDGSTDEDLGATIPVVTFPRPVGGGTVSMMVYEASRPDATSDDAGSRENVACSKPGVLPWTIVRWGEANTACRAIGAGWRLCDSSDWQRGCEASGGTCDWSYASSCSSSQPVRCNGDEYDCGAASGDQDCVDVTGSPAFPACYANWGGGRRIFDLSGNVKEWTNTSRGGAGVHEIRGGAYNNVEGGRTCEFDFTLGDGSFRFPNTGFRCCRY